MQLKIPALYFSYQKLQGMIDMNFSRKKAAHAVLAWTLSLALAAPAASMTALAATDNTTQTQQTTDTQNQQPPQPSQGAQNGQPPMGPPPDGQAPNGQQGQPPQGAPGQQQGKSASELTAAKVVDGTVTVHDGTFATSGQGSPNVYSTGNISVYNSKGKATASEIAVVEGKNSIVLDGVDLTGSKDHGVMLYQSFSGDAGVGEASFSAKDSTLRNLSDGPMFFVTNTKAKASLENVELQQQGSVLVNVAAGRWGTTGANGGDFTLSAQKQVLTGDVKADSLSSMTLQLGEAADYEGAFNAENTAKNAAITLAAAAKWTLTSDAYVTTIEDAAKDYKNIASNGHNIYYDAAADTALGGKTYALPGGGRLLPKK